MINTGKFIRTFCVHVCSFALISFPSDLALADARSDAQAQCERKLGQGANAEEELDFGEVSYVCNCTSPYKWNASNTQCVGASGQSDSVTRTNESTPEAPKVATPEPVIAPQIRSAAMYDKGLDAYRKKRYSTALLWFNRAAEKQNKDAMFYLGVFYDEGFGVARDKKTAVRWYEKAANLGEIYSLHLLGNAYYFGAGVKKNYSKAAVWYQKAIKNNHFGGAHNLGLLYEKGKGVPRNRSRAANHMAQALKSGEWGKFSLKEMTTNANAWSKQFRRELQKILRSEGVYNGRIDGSFGEGTKRAIRKLAGQ